jgi:hypothetical protein
MHARLKPFSPSPSMTNAVKEMIQDLKMPDSLFA